MEPIPPTTTIAGYFPSVEYPAWFHDREAVKARLRVIGGRRYLDIDDGPDRSHRICDAFTEVIELLHDPEDPGRTHRRHVRLGLIMALATRFSISLYEGDNPKLPKVRDDIAQWLESGSPIQGPVGLDLLPVQMTAEQVRDEAVEVHRTLSEMPGDPQRSAELLWDILDLTLDGFAVFSGSQGKRDLFHWWLSQAVPAAYMERLPDHIYSGSWPWPPRAPEPSAR